MHCSGIRNILPGQIQVLFQALLIVSIFFLPLSTEATETPSDQTAAQSQESDAAQGSEAGQSNDGGSGEESGGEQQEETEEEPDC